MKVIYSPKQAMHSATQQLNAFGIQPYPEVHARVEAILAALGDSRFEVIEPKHFERQALLMVHAPDYLDFLERGYAEWVATDSANEMYASAFVPRMVSRPSQDIRGRVGWYMADTYTRIVAGTWKAALASAECALTGAELVANGERAVYALCRPPGHHAGRDFCGGFCFLNNAALAAEYLRRTTREKVSILDIDYHHGNGTQQIFYESADVQYVSIHADPAQEYPFFSGYGDETGAGTGRGTTVNLPIPVEAGEAAFTGALEAALEAIRRFGARALVVSFGADICAGDPEGSFGLKRGALQGYGARIAEAGLPTVIVQEGGYVPEALASAIAFFVAPFT